MKQVLYNSNNDVDFVLRGVEKRKEVAKEFDDKARRVQYESSVDNNMLN